MKTLGLFDLKDQLNVLLNIKNPSQWICIAIDKLTEQISDIEFAQREDYLIKMAINEIEIIATKYPDLKVYYSNKYKDKQPVNSFANPANSQNAINNIPAKKSNNEVNVKQTLWL